MSTSERALILQLFLKDLLSVLALVAFSIRFASLNSDLKLGLSTSFCKIPHDTIEHLDENELVGQGDWPRPTVPSN